MSLNDYLIKTDSISVKRTRTPDGKCVAGCNVGIILSKSISLPLRLLSSASSIPLLLPTLVIMFIPPVDAFELFLQSFDLASVAVALLSQRPVVCMCE